MVWLENMTKKIDKIDNKMYETHTNVEPAHLLVIFWLKSSLLPHFHACNASIYLILFNNNVMNQTVPLTKWLQIKVKTIYEDSVSMCWSNTSLRSNPNNVCTTHTHTLWMHVDVQEFSGGYETPLIRFIELPLLWLWTVCCALGLEGQGGSKFSFTDERNVHYNPFRQLN